MADFDVLVLGAGSGGYACALRAAQLGLRVGLVESEKLGGTCLHAGCIPTKALLHAGEVADSAREAGSFGVLAHLDGVDMPAVLAYQQSVVSRLHKGLTGLVGSRGITMITGHGTLTGAQEVTVDGEPHTAPHIVLATGSRSRTLPGIEIDGVRVITSDHAVRLDHLPQTAIVLGGGVIGCEFASAWRSLGVEVTILEALPRLLPGEDEACSAALRRALTKRGISVRTSTPARGVNATQDGVTVALDDAVLDADLLLVAVGRGPVTDGLGFAEAGVVIDNGFVRTDELGRTNLPGVYAVGDIVAGPQLAHRGFAQGIVVAELIAGLAPRPIEDELLPRVTYSRPEVASVGLSEATARERFGDVDTVTYDLAGNGRSQILRTQGFVKLVRRHEGPVVGIHMVGDHVGELIGEAQLICGWEGYPEDVAPLIHAHPTQNEALGEAHLALAGRPLHAHS